MALFTPPVNGQTLVIENKKIDIFPKDTVQAYYAFSNNDASEKNIYAHVKNIHDAEIDFSGANLAFHGRITPFILDECENVTIKNLTIDYARTFYTQGKVVFSDRASVVLDISSAYPYRLEDGNLIMEGEHWENDLHDGIMLFQEFDRETKSPAYNSPVLVCRVGRGVENDPTAPLPMHLLGCEITSEGFLKLTGDIPCTYTPGNILVMTHEKRENPAFGIHKCKNVRLENIKILHAGSMGIIAQLSKDISLHRVVIKTEDENRIVSVNCDASHFTACEGEISITDCVFDSMMDDGVNVHGAYTRVLSKDCDTCETEIMHFQQFGVLFYRPGDTVAMLDKRTGRIRAHLTVSEARLISQSVIRVRFNEPLDLMEEDDFLENLTLTPKVHINGLKTGKNRPRGVLATTPQCVLIENCTFESSGFGIHIAGDTCFWYESGAVKDMTIRNNRFINCGRNMGDFAIAVTPEYEAARSGETFHKNIRIENNTFEGFLDGAVYAKGVDGLFIKENTIIKTCDYPKRGKTKPVVWDTCKNVSSDIDAEEGTGPFV
ncbi:MAG: right-handed parallel beta-helix repeat-containing protein [Clostridia bacterium]|nr:right-handed parallel beta-helix repeat-containing protein [Clostridia bacterium]